MIMKKCKICGTEFEAKSNRACYCSDKCKKDGERKIEHERYLKRKEEGYDFNKFNRLNPDKANKWNKSEKGIINNIFNKREKRKNNKQFCGEDIQLDNNGNPKLMMGTSDEKGLSKKQMDERNKKFKNLFG